MDEYTDDQLKAELALRYERRRRGRCCYCNRLHSDSACRFKERHHNENLPLRIYIGHSEPVAGSQDGEFILIAASGAKHADRLWGNLNPARQLFSMPGKHWLSREVPGVIRRIRYVA